MRVPHSPITAAALLALLTVSCASHHEAQLQHQTKSIQRGHYLLAATNDAPGSFYELGVYVITAGDTLGKVAQKFHVSEDDITAINPGMGPFQLTIGQRIRMYERRRE